MFSAVRIGLGSSRLASAGALRTNTSRVAGRDAEQLTDHPGRQRIGEVTHQLHATRRQLRLEELVDDLLHPARQCLDPPGRERLRHQRPQSGVVGWVSEQHEHAEQFAELALGLVLGGASRHQLREALQRAELIEVGLHLVAAEPRIAHRRRDVGVPAEQGDAERAAVHRVDPLQHPEHAVGVAPQPGSTRNTMSGGVSAAARARSAMAVRDIGPLSCRYTLYLHTVCITMASNRQGPIRTKDPGRVPRRDARRLPRRRP